MLFNLEVATKTAELLLQIKAVELNARKPFTWTSGWKSPIYCDNRKLLSYPHARNFIADKFAELIGALFPKTEVIAAVATAGIAHGMLVADRMNLPFIYVRPKPKEHGLKHQIEGVLLPKQKVVVIEDLISTGGSSLQAVHTIEESRAEVLGLAAIFTYGFQASEDRFKKAKCIFYTLSEYEILIARAKGLGYIKESDLQALRDWRLTPQDFRVGE